MNKKGFTLVELIVVITILAILGTIAFLSFQGYSASARDSVRLSDVASIEKAMDLHVIKTGKYPLPSNSTTFYYSDAVAWEQGAFGDDTNRALNALNKTPLDPKYNAEYTYSVTGNKSEYQIGYILENNSAHINTSNTAHAASSVVGVTGNYNNRLLTVRSGSTIFIVATPSIIATDTSSNNLVDILNNKKLVYNNYSALPHTYNNSSLSSQEFDYTPTNIVVFSGSSSTNYEVTDIVDIIDNMYDTYEGTILEGNLSETRYKENFEAFKVVLQKSLGKNSLKGLFPKTCREKYYLSTNNTIKDGNHLIDPDGTGGASSITVDCINTTDDELFTLYKMDSTDALHASEMEAKCEAVGLQLYVPRTKDHYKKSIDLYGSDYFRLMGVYPFLKGNSCSGLYMNYPGYEVLGSLSCPYWLPKDKGRYFISETIIRSEPNGDNDLDASMSYNYGAGGNLGWYNDIANSNSNPAYIMGGVDNNITLGGYKNNKWTCSGKDESTTMFEEKRITPIPEIIKNPLDITLYSTCRLLSDNGGFMGDGYYRLSYNLTEFISYCLNDSNGETFTITKVEKQFSQHSSQAELACNELGLQLYVPRSLSHYDKSRNAIGYYYFGIMGIYPTNKGNTCSTNHMYYNGNLGSAAADECTAWLPIDDGRYFVENNISSLEPNGDNDIDGSLGYLYHSTSGDLATYNDVVNTNTRITGGLNMDTSIGGYKTNRFACSDPDEVNID